LCIFICQSNFLYFNIGFINSFEKFLAIRQRLSWVTAWSQKKGPCVDKLSANGSFEVKTPQNLRACGELRQFLVACRLSWQWKTTTVSHIPKLKVSDTLYRNWINVKKKYKVRMKRGWKFPSPSFGKYKPDSIVYRSVVRRPQGGKSSEVSYVE
jgi:hypothetical protein